MSTINDLPTELMLEVGRLLILIDPYYCFLSYLSQTCRRFHNIFANSIVTYHSTQVVSEISVSNGYVASCQPRTSAISLNGNFREISFSLRGRTLNDTRCFRSLLFRANTISCIKLRVKDFQEVSDPVVACVLNSCVQRPDLRLIIQNYSSLPLAFEGGPFIFKDITAPAPVKKTWKDFMLGALDALSFKSYQKSTKMNKSPQKPSTCSRKEVIRRKPRFDFPGPKLAPRLTGLWIEDNYFLSASLYPWMRDIMNTAPLTHLSIIESHLTKFDWSQILSAITIPTLEYLGIGRVSVAFSDLLDFFSRHPSLQEINLTYILIGIVPFPGSTRSNFLPKLKTLFATPEYIYPFICHQLDGYFHNLNAYGIHHSYYAPKEINFDIFELLATNERRTHLSITVSWTPLNALFKWFLGTSRGFSRRKLPRIWKIVLDLGGPFDLKAHLLGDNVRALLVRRAKAMKKIAFMKGISWQNERVLLDHLFHIIFPDLQLIEYKETPGVDSDKWSMII